MSQHPTTPHPKVYPARAVAGCLFVLCVVLGTIAFLAALVAALVVGAVP